LVAVGDARDHPDMMGTTFNASINHGDNPSHMSRTHPFPQQQSV